MHKWLNMDNTDFSLTEVLVVNNRQSIKRYCYTFLIDQCGAEMWLYITEDEKLITEINAF